MHAQLLPVIFLVFVLSTFASDDKPLEFLTSIDSGHSEAAEKTLKEASTPEFRAQLLHARLPANGKTALHLAISNGLHDIVYALIPESETESQKLTLDINAKDKDGLTPLHLACKLGDMEMVHFLVEHSADWRSKVESNEWCPIHYAAAGETEGHWGAVVNLILDMNEEEDDADDEHFNYEDHFRSNEAREQLNFLTKDLDSPFSLAAKAGNVHTVTMLAQLGSDVNHQNKEGNTALHEASLHGKEEDLVLHILDAGANVNITNNDGKTAKELASSNPKLQGVLHLFDQYLHGIEEEDDEYELHEEL